MLKALTTLFTLLLLTSTFTIAQKAPIKWGDIPKEDLSMTVYEHDAEAAAVVLCNYGQWSFEVINQELKLIYSVHRRVKILSDQGFDQADVEVLYSGNEDGTEKLIKLRAQIFSPDGKKIQLTKKEFFEEDVDRFRKRKRFTFPGVEVGSVLEYHYEIESENFSFLKDYYFQDEIPVRWSELIFERPKMYEYSISSLGTLPMDIADTKSYNETVTISGFSRSNNARSPSANSYFGSQNLDMLRSRYVIKNAPAIKPEPYITTLRDYMAKMNFQIKRVVYPSGKVEDVFTSWDDFAEELNSMEGFGRRLMGKNLKNAEDISLSHDGSPKGIMVAAHNYVTNNVSWDGDYSFISDLSVKELLTAGEGSNADLNLMLIAILRANGLNAKPAIISTRKHGMMLPFFPMIDQFNYVMAYVDVDGKAYFMDATDSRRSALLPGVKCLNKKAWIVFDGQQNWMDVKATKSKQVYSAELSLDEEGSAKGIVQVSLGKYDGYFGRSEIYESSEDDYVKNSLIDNEGVEVGTYEIENLKNPEANLNIKINCEAPEFGTASGDLIYLNPVFLDIYEENPFESEKRDYPVDIAFPFNETFVLTLTLPEGYGIEEIPENIAIALPEKGGRFQMMYQQLPGKLQVISKVDLNQTFFLPENYGIIKTYFDTIVEKQSEQVVLKKLP